LRDGLKYQEFFTLATRSSKENETKQHNTFALSVSLSSYCLWIT